MKIANTVLELQSFLKEVNHQTVGFVPTMGALHPGHISLIKASKLKTQVTVCSIFVNPLQFNNPKDLEKYPRTIEQDIILLENANCDILFLPSVEEVYPTNANDLEINFPYQNSVMEGKFRPGHFSGVAIVVSKLFHYVNPNFVFFGQKDLQQCLIIKQLIDTLSFQCTMEIIPTLREDDGLAMSSRNVRLSKEARQLAPILYKKLTEIISQLDDYDNVKSKVLTELNNHSQIKVEYIEAVDMETGKIKTPIKEGKKYGICIAANIDDVRLIDNIITVY
jgi:pantoate--beta-alanine ligase